MSVTLITFLIILVLACVFATTFKTNRKSCSFGTFDIDANIDTLRSTIALNYDGTVMIVREKNTIKVISDNEEIRTIQIDAPDDVHISNNGKIIAASTTYNAYVFVLQNNTWSEKHKSKKAANSPIKLEVNGLSLFKTQDGKLYEMFPVQQKYGVNFNGFHQDDAFYDASYPKKYYLVTNTPFTLINSNDFFTFGVYGTFKDTHDNVVTAFMNKAQRINNNGSSATSTWQVIYGTFTSLQANFDANVTVLGNYTKGMIRINTIYPNTTKKAESLVIEGPPSFGKSVAISFEGKTIAVGAPSVDSVFIYELKDNSWKNTKLFHGTNNYGIAVAMSGDAKSLAVLSKTNKVQKINL